MKNLAIILTAIIYVLIVDFTFVALTVEEGELKIPKTSVEELLTWDSVEAAQYLSDPNNYNYYNGVKKIFYTATSSPKYLLMNLILSLINVFGGMLIYKVYKGKSNAT